MFYEIEALLDTCLLELLEFGDIGLALIAEAAFLGGEIDWLFWVGCWCGNRASPAIARIGCLGL